MKLNKNIILCYSLVHDIQVTSPDYSYIRLQSLIRTRDIDGGGGVTYISK